MKLFSISGRGTVVTGRVESGVIKTGEEIEIVVLENQNQFVLVSKCFESLDLVKLDNIGALLRGVERTDVERCHVNQDQLNLILNLKLSFMY